MHGTQSFLQKVQVFFFGENLLTFTKLKGMFDPEAIFSSNSYTSEGGKELSDEPRIVLRLYC